MIHRKNLLIYGELGDISDPKVALKQVILQIVLGVSISIACAMSSC